MVQNCVIDIDGPCDVLIERSKRSKYVNISVKPGGVRIAVPYGVSFSCAKEVLSSKINWVKKQIRRMREFRDKCDSSVFFDVEASREKLLSRVNELAVLNDFVFNKVYVRVNKSQWGSCSHQNNISLNLKIMKLPEELIDYVILHELMHTKIKDHGKNFWYALDELVGDGKALDRKLKTYHPEFL